MLKILHLNWNNLRFLESGTFKYLVRCETIFLQCNRISQIEEGKIKQLTVHSFFHFFLRHAQKTKELFKKKTA